MSLQGFRFLNHGEFTLALPPDDIGLSPRDRVWPNLSRRAEGNLAAANGKQSDG